MTRKEIAEILTSIAPPGEKRDEKDAAVRAAETGVNSQGIHPADDLTDYSEY